MELEHPPHPPVTISRFVGDGEQYCIANAPYRAFPRSTARRSEALEFANVGEAKDWFGSLTPDARWFLFISGSWRLDMGLSAESQEAHILECE